MNKTVNSSTLLVAAVACALGCGSPESVRPDTMDVPEVDSQSVECLETAPSELACDDGCDDDGNGYADCVDFTCVWDQPRAVCEPACRMCGALTLCEGGLSEVETRPAFMTWNIREFDGSPAVASRIGQVLVDLQPGVVALQEIASLEALDTVTGCATGYARFATSNTDRYKVVLLIREDRFTVQEVFEVPMYNHRSILGAALQDEEGEALTVYAVHLFPGPDASDTERRRSQMDDLARFIDEREETRVVILGDFNELLSDSVRSMAFASIVGPPVFAAPVAISGSSTSTVIGRDDLDLDHILSTGGLQRAQVLRLEDVFHGYGARMSDHRPVLAW